MSDLWVQILEVMHKYYIFVLYITMLIELVLSSLLGTKHPLIQAYDGTIAFAINYVYVFINLLSEYYIKKILSIEFVRGL